jgi:hypothetical protein
MAEKKEAEPALAGYGGGGYGGTPILVQEFEWKGKLVWLEENELDFPKMNWHFPNNCPRRK